MAYYSSPYMPDFKTKEEYLNAKIKMVTKDFKIKLTPDQINYSKNLKNTYAIDRYFRDIIKKHLNEHV